MYISLLCIFGVPYQTGGRFVAARPSRHVPGYAKNATICIAIDIIELESLEYTTFIT